MGFGKSLRLNQFAPRGNYLVAAGRGVVKNARVWVDSPTTASDRQSTGLMTVCSSRPKDTARVTREATIAIAMPLNRVTISAVSPTAKDRYGGWQRA
jgi:hypothetical protein